MNREEYENSFQGSMTGGGKKARMEKALDLALDIRKFEIDLYWKRAAYFWTFIGAAFTGYALVYTKADRPNTGSDLLLLFACLGFLFSLAWYLVNRGSKFWQNNWERHVDLLENGVVGPLYEVVASNVGSKNPLTAAGAYSVSKINQILSFFILLFWALLILKCVLPVSPNLELDFFKMGTLILTGVATICLLVFAKSSIDETKASLTKRKVTVVS